MNELCECNEKCGCTVESGMYEWVWDTSFESSGLLLDAKNLQVTFHPRFSAGTAAIRGNKIMKKGRHYYWEVKMMTRAYGTDVMVGVGTKNANLKCEIHTFCSLLGIDGESWGYSYRGFLQHRGQTKKYTSCFKQGNLVGVHLDTWKGTLQFFLDRKPLGIAFTGLKGLELYPMVCSTAATSKMKITYSCSTPVSLQMECLSILKPIQRAYLSVAFPGLKYLSKSIFADILKKKLDDEEDDNAEYDLPNDYLILDEFDFALVGCKKVRDKNRFEMEY